MTALLVVLGGALGAPARWAVTTLLHRRSALPFGTFAVNAVGSYALGVTAAAAAGGSTYALVGTGFCGALTTFSTFGWDLWLLLGRRRAATAVGYAAASVVVGVALAAAGWTTGTALRG